MTLHYSSPGHGDWGVVRIGMLAPESCQLFVCPSACGRHGAIGAMKQQLKDRLFYLYVDQKDIISGYDDLILNAVLEVLEAIDWEPKVFFIFVSCLDDLIGTDREALLEQLDELYPQMKFRFCHMNPISLGSTTPPPVSIQNNLYSLLDEQGNTDAGINAIGNLVRTAPSSELYDFLEACGKTPLRHISDYQTMEAYQAMARSSASLVLGAPGRQAAGKLETRLGIPWLFTPITYDMEEIARQYRQISAFLTGSETVSFSFEDARIRAEKAIAEAREKLGDIPLIIDASAVCQPFGLARTLLLYGFTVKRVEAQDCMVFDSEHKAWLEEHHPELELCKPEEHRAVLFDRRAEDTLAIGVEGAYLAGSRHVANLFNDEGMFGYDGICRLMALLIDAADHPVDLKALINNYGLVV
ncbi:MAG: nitrogenase component 1 [Lachnospiraceae bacterium]